MRHRVKDKTLNRTKSHREATLAALVGSLIEQKRIKTTIAKAKETRSLAEKMVTLARKGTLQARRKVISVLKSEKPVSELFDNIAPKYDGRPGGYTRIIKLGRRRSDGSEMVILEWVDLAPPVEKKRKKKAVEEVEA